MLLKIVCTWEFSGQNFYEKKEMIWNFWIASSFLKKEMLSLCSQCYLSLSFSLSFSLSLSPDTEKVLIFNDPPWADNLFHS